MSADSLPVSFRRVTSDDKPRILEICAGIWDGHDYVPSVLDAWLAADDADLIGVSAGGALIGFGHCVWMSPTYAWFEGLRIDSAWRNRGIASALHEHMLEWAGEAGATRVGLSVYLDNQISLRIVESHGFEQAAGFVVLEARAEGLPHAQARAAEDVFRVSRAEAAAYIGRSAFLERSRGFLPRNWRFYPYALGSERALAQMTHLLGIRRGDQLAALACIGAGEATPTAFALNFLDGSEDDMATLARHVLSLADGATVEAMAPAEAIAPAGGGHSNPLLGVLSGLGFSAWNDFATDVFVYERPVGALPPDRRLR